MPDNPAVPAPVLDLFKKYVNVVCDAAETAIDASGLSLDAENSNALARVIVNGYVPIFAETSKKAIEMLDGGADFEDCVRVIRTPAVQYGLKIGNEWVAQQRAALVVPTTPAPPGPEVA